MLAQRLRHRTTDAERTWRRPPDGAVIPVGIIALFGFSFAIGLTDKSRKA
jgi:hypothetical protein